MSLFKEEIISNNNQQQGFREVKLMPFIDPTHVRRIDLQTDWFNHETYLSTTEKRLRTIQKPKIISGRNTESQATHSFIIDLDQERPSKPSLLGDNFIKPPAKERSKQFKFSKLEVNKLDCSHLTPDKSASSLVDAQDLVFKSLEEDMGLLSNDLKLFSKEEIRKQLNDSLIKSQEVKDLLQEANMFKTINSEGLFSSPQVFQFAEIHHHLPFVKESQLTKDNFFALAVGEGRTMNSFNEFVAYQLLVRNEAGSDYPYLLNLNMDQKKPEEYDIGKVFNDVNDLDKSQIFQDLKKQLDVQFKEGILLSLKDLNSVSKAIEQETEFGVMLYFGSLKISKSYTYQEKSVFPQILQQVLLGLKTLQQKGNMVLKIRESFAPSTVGIIVLLTKLFENVLLAKPVVSTPLKPTQYLVCEGLRKAQPKEVIKKLEVIYQQLLLNQGKYVGSIMNDKDLLEDHKTIDYIKKTNDLIAVHRKSHLEQALDSIYPTEKQVDFYKDEYLRLWGFHNDIAKDHPQQNDTFHPFSVRGDHPRFSKYQPPEPDYPKVKQPSEDELARQQKLQDEEKMEFLSGIMSDSKKKEEENQKRLEQQRKQRELQRKKKEEQEKQKKIEYLKQKIQGKQGKAKASKKKGEEIKSESKVNVQGNKISIALESQPKEMEKGERKRDAKAQAKEEKQRGNGTGKEDKKPSKKSEDIINQNNKEFEEGEDEQVLLPKKRGRINDNQEEEDEQIIEDVQTNMALEQKIALNKQKELQKQKQLLNSLLMKNGQNNLGD